jgi:N-acetylmuramoyl-L-alanine amidase
MRIVVIPGHGLIGVGAPDPGGTGGGGAENAWTQRAALAVVGALLGAGHEVGLISAGSSVARSALADTIGADLVLYLHGDVGAGGVFYYPSSAHGQPLAVRLASALDEVLPGLAVKAATSAGYPRAFGLLGRTVAPAVLLELCDQRSPESVARIVGHLDLIAAAVVRALEEPWTTSRGAP